MRKKLLSVMLITVMSIACLSGCSGSNNDASDKTTTETAEKKVETSAVAFERTVNPDTFPLNGEDVYMEDDGCSYVKIATIWDETLTIYDAETFTKDSKAIAITFEVSDYDLEPTTCYWNYMIADSKGNEISCWDTNYQTDDIEIKGDGTYQMVYDYSKVEGQDVAEIKSLQIVFPNSKPDTATKVKVTEAVCITDEAEIGKVYKTGIVE